MGVHGLWELLSPVGRRVSVETLAGKKLAIDASIWMIQFMKAMRDEKGEMVRNAHILGFFRRICKLLYLRTKPVFVFDGGTPALKRRTVIARRRQRENAQAKIRKTAEKLLLNHVKAMRLKEMADDLEKQRHSNDVKGKKITIQEPNLEQKAGNRKDEAAISYNQEELDAMLAASLAAEESEGFTGDASTSGAGVPLDEDEDEDEEIILPEMHGKVDPAVLASLPPSMQLDLLVQMRERLMAENRQKYQKVKKAPARFSELQIQSYLKTVAFRREIDGVQKSASGRGIGGVQTSRIASEANREFIFSSSFTGDKEAFTSVGQERIDSDQSQPPPMNSSVDAVNGIMSTISSGAAAGTTGAETAKTFHDDVETYLDERGRPRVSRVRALGIRMTRDLQRNLDLMKEVEQEKAGTNQENSETTITRNVVDVLSSLSDRFQYQEVTDQNNDGLNGEVEKTEEPAMMVGTSIEVSFEDNCELESGNADDNLFARLVAGEPVTAFSIGKSASAEQLLDSTSDCEWEEGVVEDKIKESPLEGAKSDESEVEWEEGLQDTQLKSLSYPDENHLTISKGVQEEEATLQEAIRRSLEDMKEHISTDEPRKDQIPGIARDTVSHDIDLVSVLQGDKGTGSEVSATDVSQPLQIMRPSNILEISDSEEKSAACVEVSLDESSSDQKLLSEDARESEALAGKMFLASADLSEEKALSMIGKSLMDTCNIDDDDHAVDKVAGTSSISTVGSSFNDLRPDRLRDSDPVDAQHVFQEALDDHSCEAAKIGNIYANDSVTDPDGAKELFTDKNYGDFSVEKEDPTSKSSFLDADENPEVMKDRLDEEMLFLDKEREELGNEQRRLERNAESVNSEMFVECQELLQMFGLPYIIAPMEAEAQCAFMELSNLVDGVVTDDSDAFLFGARSVYKNIFDDRKYVETYLMKDIENELGLDREKLVHMALLLGSDYTEGVSGIGIVNAIEVVNAFPEKDGLREFREWIESPDPAILGKLGTGGNKSKVSKVGKSGSSSKTEGILFDQNVPQSVDDTEQIKQIFMDKHRNVSKNWHIPSSFPSDAVISAYASPQVDKSTETFSWGKPDLFVLRKLCWEKFGWGSSKADELLLPVLKEYNKHETQLRLEAFYTFNERFAKIRSKRVKKAVKGITGDKLSELIKESMPQQSGSRKKRKAQPTEDEANQPGVEECAGGTSNQTSTTEKPTHKQSKGKRTKEKIAQTNLQHSTNVNPNARKQSEEPGQVRRSGRLRKSVNYTVSDESDNCDKESENSLNENAKTKESHVDQAVGVNETDNNVLNECTNVDELEEGGLIGYETEQGYNVDTKNTSQTGGSEIDYPQSKDYLQSGGGFCVEDDEETNPEKSNKFDSANSVEEENHETDMSISTPRTSDGRTGLFVSEPIMYDDAQNDGCLMDDTENTSGNRYASSLRAMPNLRKKKRKT
ncbi:hypothetical protein ACJIZ3_007916 [Penstemon smallii]|uniref:DNA repair protein UVH3 n=1 Tax=Penstemon smallii TaxID=265156 RepID=A0ABD3T8B1_9LAMI